MIRERVGIRGALRELEPMDQLGAFSLPASEMHVVKANMVQRFMTGQHLWARKYPSTRYLERREALRKKWIAENPQEIDLLAGECPPPAALAGRRDTVSIPLDALGADERTEASARTRTLAP